MRQGRIEVVQHAADTQSCGARFYQQSGSMVAGTMEAAARALDVHAMADLEQPVFHDTPVGEQIRIVGDTE
jgi:hypothetical protein